MNDRHTNNAHANNASIQRNDFAAQLEHMRQSFATSLPARRAHIQSAWHLLANETNNVLQLAQLHLLHRDVHGLTGSAGTFGFTEVSQACRDFEQFLKGLRENPNLLTTAQLQHGNALLTACLDHLPSIDEATAAPIDPATK